MTTPWCRACREATALDGLTDAGRGSGRTGGRLLRD